MNKTIKDNIFEIVFILIIILGLLFVFVIHKKKKEGGVLSNVGIVIYTDSDESFIKLYNEALFSVALPLQRGTQLKQHDVDALVNHESFKLYLPSII